MKKEGKESISAIKKEHPIVQKRIKKALKCSVKEGSYANASTYIGPSYFSPFALALGATSPQIGVLNAFANILPGISQFYSSRKFQENNKKRIIILRLLSSYILLFALSFCGLLYLKGISSIIWIVIAIIGLHYFISGPVVSYWYVWMGSLVSQDKRGNFFSKRLKTTQFFGMIAMILSAFFLDWIKKYGENIMLGVEYTIYGFIIIFTISFFLRLKSISLLRQQYEPRIKIKKKQNISLKQFLKEEPKTPFGKFVIFTGLFRLSMAIASPFFVVYMLNVLNFSYIWFIFITIGGIFFNILFLPSLSRISEKYGSILLTKLSCISISLVPLVWLSTPFLNLSNIGLMIYIFILTSLFYGFGSAGLILVERTYTFDANSISNRKYAFPYLNLSMGLGIFIGSLFGSLLALTNISILGNNLLFIFLISLLLRLIISIFGTKKLHDVRDVKKFKPEYLIKEIRPFHSLNHEVHPIAHHNYKVVHHI